MHAPIIVDGKKIAEGVYADIAKDIATLKRVPKLIAILVGKDPASVAYLKVKRAACKRAGIAFTLYEYPEAMTTAKLRTTIAMLRKKDKPDSIIMQLPLPPHINTQYILDAIPTEQDADALSSRAKGLLAVGKSLVIPPTAAAVLKILAVHNVSVTKSHVVLAGMGLLVGKPLLAMLSNTAASITAVHAGTPDITRFTREADILITGIGKPGLITANMVKPGVVALDAGYGRMGDTVSGDLDFRGVAQHASLITPVPGGIGPLTVALLLSNVVKLAMRTDRVSTAPHA